MRSRGHEETPVMRISSRAGVVEPSASDAMREKRLADLTEVLEVLLDELDVEAGLGPARDPSLRIEVAPCVSGAALEL
jgi:hypothetical protein